MTYWAVVVKSPHIFCGISPVSEQNSPSLPAVVATGAGIKHADISCEGAQGASSVWSLYLIADGKEIVCGSEHMQMCMGGADEQKRLNWFVENLQTAKQWEWKAGGEKNQKKCSVWY